MKKKPRNLRARTAARVVQRSEQKVQGLRHKLAELEPGGSREHPIEVASASVIEPRAESFPCLRCNAHTRAATHESVGESIVWMLSRKAASICICARPLRVRKA